VRPVVVTSHCTTPGGVSEPVKVIELLKRKADCVRAGKRALPDNSAYQCKGKACQGNVL
jgi:hypothetical protein